MMQRFTDKVAMVTGSTLGLGEAIARHLAGEGLSGLIVTGRNIERGTAVARSLGDTTTVEFVAADLADNSQVADLIARSALARRESVGAHYRSDFLLKAELEKPKHSFICKDSPVRFA